ncbi:putative steroid-binding protein 3 [Iris pallida]|uniref:Steroid-binding protein 3 n=1 Tax=Iris pallida TaxID=29817 RepID=A0AAX6HRN2_IRIPA|nr:putative steroid-binding protein 3 [Iris pallida]KAJ6843670.1 putative steroid-binding protein 3 [Iris pallida]
MSMYYSRLSGVIDEYTGLSPSALFTILALMVGAYLLVSSLFVSPEAIAEAEAKNKKKKKKEEEKDDDVDDVVVPPPAVPPPPPAEPVQMGDVTLEELKAFDGSDPGKPLLMAIKGNIFDVSVSRMFYGPGGPYALFAGRDASRALALMSFDANDLTGNLEGLSSSELEVLQDWEYKFMEKYNKVGQLVSERTAGKDDDQSGDERKEVQESARDAEGACEAVKNKAPMLSSS